MINALEKSISSRTEINNINNGLEKMKNIILSGNDLKYDDELYILWENDIVSFYVNKNLIGTINCSEIGKYIFTCYLDDNSITNDLITNFHN